MDATATPPIDAPRELACRMSGGVEVLLLWRASDGAVFVVVRDVKTGGGFVVDTDPAEAMHAYRHPYAYAPYAVDAAVAA